jgi:hypothetical protein
LKTSTFILSPNQSIGTLFILDGGGGDVWDIDHVYPFDTVQMMRQRILLHAVAGTTSPYVFLAVKESTGDYTPLDFVWPFTKSLPDPFTVLNTVDPHLMDGDIQKPVFPTLLHGITYEAAGAPREIHVWRLSAVWDGTTAVGPAVFGGFYRLFFPTLRSPADMSTVLSKDSLDVMQAFAVNRQEHLGVLDSQLTRLGDASPPPPRTLRWSPGVASLLQQQLYYRVRTIGCSQRRLRSCTTTTAAATASV